MTLFRIVMFAVVTTTVACAPSGDAPKLDPMPDQVAQVGQQLVLVLTATDNDGDKLTYRFDSIVPDIHDRAEISLRPDGAGVFKWRPLAADVGTWWFDFTVDDGTGTDTITVQVQVKSAVGDGSSPIFREPLGTGTTLNLDESDCLDVHVLVEDSDSASVVIGQKEPVIDGATLTMDGGLAATWHWCPSESQIDADDRYQLVLTANDLSSPVTYKSYLIVLRKATKPDCPGAAPVITHSPEDEATLVGLTLTADISDDQGLKGEPLLYYSTTAPATPPDLSTMTQVTMLLLSGTNKSGTWGADVPNPVAGQAEGTTARVYYVMLADDNDDAEGDCDHVTQAPTQGYFEMQVRNPGGAGGAGTCEPCTADLQCGQAADLCVRVGATAESFCMQACSGASDCPTNYSCSPEAVTSVNGTSSRQCIPNSGNCEDPGGTGCVDDSYEDNDGNVQAAANAVLPPGEYTDMVSCPAETSGDDEDWYRVVVTEDTVLDVTVTGSEVTDIDLGLHDSAGGYIVSSTGSTSTESISPCVQAGTYFIRVYAFRDARNPYTLRYSSTPMSCATPPPMCIDDEAEDDDNEAQATDAEPYPDGFVAMNRAICPDDSDWYFLFLYTGDQVTVELMFTQADGDLDMQFRTEAGVDQCTAEGCRSTSDDETFTYTVADAACNPCTYYVVVDGYDGAENLYDLAISVVAAGH